MCTAVTYRTKDFYFGRNLDYEHGYGEEIVIIPRDFPMNFATAGNMEHHLAMMGMAYVADGYPLMFDGINEKGLAMAGLNFVGNACYGGAAQVQVPQYAFIPWILAQCETVAQARTLLKNTAITAEAFRPDLPPAQLHWLIADREEAITVEAVAEGLRVYDNPVGVLTNNPTFPQQMLRLADYMALSPEQPVNRFGDGLSLEYYSRGMGAMGLPGDLSSGSRFVRGAFVKMHALSGDSEAESVGQMFQILGSVSQPRGCCRLPDGSCEVTIYTSCCNASRGIYYYTTYGNRRITAVDMHREDLESREVIRYPLLRQEDICWQNTGERMS